MTAIDHKLVELEHRKKAAEALAEQYAEIGGVDSHHFYKGVAEGLAIAINIHKDRKYR